MNPQQQCEQFLQSRNSMVLSTLDLEGSLETSVAPFVMQDDCFFIFVSELAKHTQNMLQQLKRANERDELALVSGLLLSDEKQSEQLFARERISFQLVVSEVVATEPMYDRVLTQFSEQFGEIVSVLRGLPDFHLFALKSQNGGYVRGFGQAFAFEGMPNTGLKAVKRN